VYHSHRTQCGRKADGVARQRLDLRGAAEALGTSVDAVRKRVARGTLESEKVDGKVYVWLDDGAPRSDTDALISEMHGRVEDLREQLEAERQAHAEARRLLAAALERIPLEPPSEPSEAPLTPSEPRPSTTTTRPPEAERPAAPHPATGEAQESVQTTAPDASRTLPFWGYVLGLILTGMTEFLLTSSYHLIVRPIFGGVVPEDVLLVVTVILPLSIPIIFGFWVGRNYKGTNLWGRLGATVVLILAASLLLSRVLLDISIVAQGGSAFFPEMMPTFWLWPVSIAFLSSALIGDVVRRRVVGYTPGAGSANNQWSPLALTLIGTTGNILAAVISGIFALVSN
jgi:hypothetical protein